MPGQGKPHQAAEAPQVTVGNIAPLQILLGHEPQTKNHRHKLFCSTCLLKAPSEEEQHVSKIRWQRAFGYEGLASQISK